MRPRNIVLEVHDIASAEIIGQALYYREHSPGGTLEARWDAAVMEAFASLLSAPERGALCRFQAPGLHGMRRVPISGFPKHLVFYLFLAEARAVHILHVLHGARDLDAFFDD